MFCTDGASAFEVVERFSILLLIYHCCCSVVLLLLYMLLIFFLLSFFFLFDLTYPCNGSCWQCQPTGVSERPGQQRGGGVRAVAPAAKPSRGEVAVAVAMGGSTWINIPNMAGYGLKDWLQRLCSKWQTICFHWSPKESLAKVDFSKSDQEQCCV